MVAYEPWKEDEMADVAVWVLMFLFGGGAVVGGMLILLRAARVREAEHEYMDLGDTARARRYAALFIAMGTLILVLMVADVAQSQRLEAARQAAAIHAGDTWQVSDQAEPSDTADDIANGAVRIVQA